MCEPSRDPCDMNRDGAIDAFDIEPFPDLLFGPYQQVREDGAPDGTVFSGPLFSTTAGRDRLWPSHRSGERSNSALCASVVSVVRIFPQRKRHFLPMRTVPTAIDRPVAGLRLCPLLRQRPAAERVIVQEYAP